MEDFEQKTDSVEEEKITSSEISCAEEATENCIEMTVNQDEEMTTEASAEAEEIRNPEEERPVSRGKKILVPLLSFFVPVLLFGLAWANNGITYGGNVTPLIYDMNAQYMPFIASLRYLFEEDASLLFNWNVCLGGDYLSLFAYYLASPINLLSVFFDLKDMPDAIYVITLIKIGLCGLNFSTFLRCGMSNGKARWRDILFASCYALMSYNVMYSMCIMWLDGVLMMPLVLLGILRLFDEKKGVMYFLSIFATFYCNFYISYMVGVFTAVFFAVVFLQRYTTKKSKVYLKIFIKFVFFTIAAAGLCMPIILPTLHSISGGYGEAMISSEAHIEMYSFSILDLLKKILPQQYDSIEFSGLPSIYCGTIMVLLMLIYFAQRRSIKEKVSSLILLIAPFLGFVLPAVDYAWHGFQYPHSYMYRYAFTFSFGVLFLAYQAFDRIVLNALFGKILIGTAAAYTLFELFLNGSVLISGLNTETAYYIRAIKDLQCTLQEPLLQKVRNEQERRDFFRTSFGSLPIGDCSLLMYGVNGTECFTSTFNYAVNSFLRANGASTEVQVTTTKESTLFLNSLLNVRYLLSAERLGIPYKYVDKSNYNEFEIYLYENSYSLPLGFMIDDAEPVQTEDNPFNVQNSVARSLGSSKNLFYQIDVKVEQRDEGTVLQFLKKNNEIPYLYVADLRRNESLENEYIEIVVDGKFIYYVEEGRRRCIDLALLEDGVEHEILFRGVPELSPENYLINVLDMTVFASFIEEQKSSGLKNVCYGKNWISGDVVSNDKQILFTSIPYSEGWTVYVDDIPTEVGTAFDTFLCVAIPEGNHHIEMEYFSVGLKDGLGVAFVFATCAMVYFLWELVVKNTLK